LEKFPKWVKEKLPKKILDEKHDLIGQYLECQGSNNIDCPWKKFLVFDKRVDCTNEMNVKPF
jgi:hypothetical protein